MCACRLVRGTLTGLAAKGSDEEFGPVMQASQYLPPSAPEPPRENSGEGEGADRGKVGKPTPKVRLLSFPPGLLWPSRDVTPPQPQPRQLHPLRRGGVCHRCTGCVGMCHAHGLGWTHSRGQRARGRGPMDMRPGCCRDASEMRPRCGQDAPVVKPRCCRGIVPVWRRVVVIEVQAL